MDGLPLYVYDPYTPRKNTKTFLERLGDAIYDALTTGPSLVGAKPVG